MNRDENLFLTLECRLCGTKYVFWRDISLEEVKKYLLEFGNCDPKCDLQGELL